MTYIRKLSGTVNAVPIGEVLTNSTGQGLSAEVPICFDPATGLMSGVDVSNEGHARTLYGITAASIANNAQGTVITSGRLENVSIVGDLGDEVYVSKAGTLTTDYPEIGMYGFVALDFILEVGFLVKNTTDPLKKDLIIKFCCPVQLG